MTAIPLGISAYRREAAKTWPVFLQNMYVEKDPSNEVDGLVRIQRPVLTRFFATSGGAARGLFQHAGCFGGDYLAVLGSMLYRVTGAAAGTGLGVISEADRVIIAASETRALIATGNICHSTNGATIGDIAMPAGEPIGSVAFMNGYFILTQKNSHRFYWIEPGQEGPDAFSFASVENAPGNIQLVLRFQDELWFFKENSMEVWAASGNLDAPFLRIPGRLFDRGIANKDTAFVLDNALFWVGDDGIVYRAGGAPQRISDHALEEKIQQAGYAALSGYAFAHQGHTFYALRIGAKGTFLFDVENGNWIQWFSYGQPTWRAVIAVQNGATVIAGDDATATLWKLDQTLNRDWDNTPVERIVYGLATILGRPVTCDCVRVVVAPGYTLSLTAEPVMELNFSDDPSGLFDGPWYPISLGKHGQYAHVTEQRQLGLMYPPGRLFALRCTDDVPFRVSYARMNED